MSDKFDEMAREIVGPRRAELAEWAHDGQIGIIASALRQVERETLERAKKVCEEVADDELYGDLFATGAGECVRRLQALSPTPTELLTTQELAGGYVRVPVEPTEEMLKAGCATYGMSYRQYSWWMAKVYRAMIQAAEKGE